MLGSDELRRRLGYHPAGPATVPLYELNRALALLVAGVWDQALPPGRESALALTSLQDALMWANAAVACNADPADHPAPEVDVATELDEVLERLEGPELTRDGARWGGPAHERARDEARTLSGEVLGPVVRTLTPEQVQGLTRPLLSEREAARLAGEPSGPELSRIRGEKRLEGPDLTRTGVGDPLQGDCQARAPRSSVLYCERTRGHDGEHVRGDRVWQ
jgi:hypothetical protein